MGGFVNKVTEKSDKLSKEQLERVIKNISTENERLKSLNEDLNAVFESISSSLVIVDNDWKLVQKNKSAEVMLGFPKPNEIDDETSYFLWDLISETEISAFIKNCAEKSITNAVEEFTVATEGGLVRFYSVMVSPFFHQNELVGKIVTVKDVTDSKNHDILKRRMENMTSLTNLAAGMAHEIKNPLGAISIHIQLIQKALQKARDNNDILPPPKFVENHIDVVNEEIDHLNNLVMDYLFAVRPINASLQLRDPNKAIQNIVDFFTPEFRKHGINIELELDGLNHRILIDEKLFRDVLMNIAQNALAAIQSRFAECKGEVCENDEFPGVFEIKTRIKDGKFLILVSDNGCGMSSETVSKIFEPYYTTKANGTGLGMTMVYKIVKEFNGDIHVSSVENEGTQFVMAFPLPQSDTKLLR